MKRMFSVAVVLSLIVMLGGCKKGGVSSENSGGKAGAQGVTKGNLFAETIGVFKGFEDIVIKNKSNPTEGAKACKEYVEKNIPKIKSLEEGIKKSKTDSNYLNEMMSVNKEIKEISDRVTKVVTESYGVEGSDVLLQLSDMALARL